MIDAPHRWIIRSPEDYPDPARGPWVLEPGGSWRRCEPAALAGFLPVMVWGDDAVRVAFVDAPGQRLDAPFYHETLGAIAEGPPRAQAVAGAHSLAHIGAPLPIAGVVFHVARCGSTLTANLLKGHPAHTVVAEPPPFNAALYGSAEQPDLITPRLLGDIAGLLAHPRDPVQRRCFFKLTSWNLFFAETVRQALPGVPFAFQYREPLEVAASLMDGPPGWMREQDPLIASHFEEPERERTLAEFCAEALGAYYRAGLALAEQGAGLLCYAHLHGDFARLLDAWSVPADDAERAAMFRALDTHSKRPSEAFVEDGERKRKGLDPEVAVLVERWARPPFDALEALRQQVR